MEKTIEERAEKYSHSPIPSLLIRDIMKFDYIKGATEQKAIDDDHLRNTKKMVIDKACEWLRARNVLTEASLEGFLKVMEE